MEFIKRYLENIFLALLLFAILYFAFFVQGIVQGGVYNIYGESFEFGLFIYPAIVLGMSIYGTNKSKKWYVMPIITLIVLLVFFSLVMGDTFNLFLIVYLVISMIGSAITQVKADRVH